MTTSIFFLLVSTEHNLLKPGTCNELPYQGGISKDRANLTLPISLALQKTTEHKSMNYKAMCFRWHSTTLYGCFIYRQIRGCEGVRQKRIKRKRGKCKKKKKIDTSDVQKKTGGVKDKMEGRRRNGETNRGRCEVSLLVAPSL